MSVKVSALAAITLAGRKLSKGSSTTYDRGMFALSGVGDLFSQQRDMGTFELSHAADLANLVENGKASVAMDGINLPYFVVKQLTDPGKSVKSTVIPEGVIGIENAAAVSLFARFPLLLTDVTILGFRPILVTNEVYTANTTDYTRFRLELSDGTVVAYGDYTSAINTDAAAIAIGPIATTNPGILLANTIAYFKQHQVGNGASDKFLPANTKVEIFYI